MKPFIDRIVRASKLDENLYEEVKSDKRAPGQSASVVILSSLAAGLGVIGRSDFIGSIIILVITLLGWYIWVYTAYFTELNIFPRIEKMFSPSEGKRDHEKLMSVIGYSAAPGFIRILVVVPLLGGVLFLSAYIWMAAAIAIFIKQAFHVGIIRAFGATIIGFLFQGGLLLFIAKLLGFSISFF